MGLSWMAWTLPTAGFFVFIALCLTAMAVWEWKSPGGDPRRGVLGPRYDARRPVVHIAARKRLHTPGLARFHGNAALGRAGPVTGIWFRSIPLGLTPKAIGQQGDGLVPEQRDSGNSDCQCSCAIPDNDPTRCVINSTNTI